MYYLLVFLGLVCLAVILAMSPLVIRLIEYLLPIAEHHLRQAKAANPQSIGCSEIRDETHLGRYALDTGKHRTPDLRNPHKSVRRTAADWRPRWFYVGPRLYRVSGIPAI